MPYAPTSRTRSRSATPRVLPDPGAVALLGTVLELVVREPDGRKVRHSWDASDAPGLLWSPSQKALLVFPGKTLRHWKEVGRHGDVRRNERIDMREMAGTLKKMGVTNARQVQTAGKLFTQWAARPSTRFAQFDTPDDPGSDKLKLKLAGSAFSILYRSDKWNGRDGKCVDYIHHFAKTGTVKVSVANGRQPKAFFIKGGRLTVNDRGIIY